MLGNLAAIDFSLPYIKTIERYPSIYSIAAIGDLVTFDYSRLRRNLASVVYDRQYPVSVCSWSS